MDPMQADALRRAREMQTNAQTTPNGRNTEPRPPKTTADDPPRKAEQHTQKQGGHPFVESVSHPTLVNDRLCNDGQELSLFADKEKLLILALLLILSTEENSDPVLTLALLYLII